ncbi:MAG: tungstate ABC transporter ATP-binding protein WtpC [Sediminispirochaetaceae bacterium]
MIQIQGISKNLGEFFLKDVTLEIQDSEYLIILGPTGAGKTILLETIAGIYPPDDGKVLLNGRDITRLPPRHRNIGMVYQDYMLFPHLNIEKNILYGLKSKRLSRETMREKMYSLTELLGITHLLHRYPGTLSGGEQQRAAIARALIMEPEALLLDEPLSALDTETRNKLQDELKRIHAYTLTTMIHVTHSFDEALALGNRIAVMNKGEIIQEGSPQEVFRKPSTTFAAEFLGVTNIFRGTAAAEQDITTIDIDGLRLASVTPKHGDVNVSVRPEDILLSLHPIESSARNSFRGTISEITSAGMISKVVVDVGVPFVTAITRRSLMDMELKPGTEVFLTFKAVDVHVF